MSLVPKELRTFRQQVRKTREIPPPEYNPWYWHPNRAGVRTAPVWFMEELWKIGEELSVTWNPITERWQVWARSPRMQHPICQGWKLLFIHKGPDGEHLPLDERVFARLYHASVYEHGSARKYFDRLASEMERDRAKREEQKRQDAIDQAMPYWEHSQIKNIGKGSKFSTYHA